MQILSPSSRFPVCIKRQFIILTYPESIWFPFVFLRCCKRTRLGNRSLSVTMPLVHEVLLRWNPLTDTVFLLSPPESVSHVQTYMRCDKQTGSWRWGKILSNLKWKFIPSEVSRGYVLFSSFTILSFFLLIKIHQIPGQEKCDDRHSPSCSSFD